MNRNMKGSPQPTLQERLRKMRLEIDSILDSVTQECEGLPESGIREVFRRKLLPIVFRHFPDGSVNFRITNGS
jgi:hypothetical protein